MMASLSCAPQVRGAKIPVPKASPDDTAGLQQFQVPQLSAERVMQACGGGALVLGASFCRSQELPQHMAGLLGLSVGTLNIAAASADGITLKRMLLINGAGYTCFAGISMYHALVGRSVSKSLAIRLAVGSLAMAGVAVTACFAKEKTPPGTNSVKDKLKKHVTKRLMDKVAKPLIHAKSQEERIGVLKRVGSVVLVGVGLVAGTVTMTLALLTRRALHRVHDTVHSVHTLVSNQRANHRNSNANKVVEN